MGEVEAGAGASAQPFAISALLAYSLIALGAWLVDLSRQANDRP